MSYPYWVTPSNLGSFPDGYSFISSPLTLDFGETNNLSCSILLLNGTLPPGVYWEQNNFSILLQGQISGVTSNTNFVFTFRINNGIYVTDQTFELEVTSNIDILTWVTTNPTLGYYYTGGLSIYEIQAQNNPLKTISYFITSSPVTKGVSIESNSGLVSVNLAWQPNTSYVANIDYVFSNNLLYVCYISGQSSASVGVTGTGNNVVDSTYPSWRGNTYYDIDSIVTNDLGKIYVCIRNGLSGPINTGPAGTGNNISDNFVIWDYIGQSVVWNEIPQGSVQNLSFNVSAATNTHSINQTFSIGLISRPYNPIWITPSGIITNTLSPNELFSYTLEIIEPDSSTVIFTSSNLPSWLSLTSNTGELYGFAPNVTSTTSYEFDIIVSTTEVLSSTQHFEIIVFVNNTQLYWNSTSNLGTILDGTYSNIIFSATSNIPSALVTYSFSGGRLPPNTVIVSESGVLSGFIDFHGQNKTYIFEVTATDGTNVVIQKFILTVIAQNIGPYITVSIPLLGKDKTVFKEENSNSLIDQSYLYMPENIHYGRNNFPELVIISGMTPINKINLRNLLSNWLTEFLIYYTTLDSTNDSSLPYQTLFVNIKDSNSIEQWKPNTSYVIGQRVSTGNGNVYVALTSGISGSYPNPSSTSYSITDGTVIWSYEGTPNTSTDVVTTLPWYPEHLYKSGQIVTNFGNLYKVVTGGYSSGWYGPWGTTTSIIDGSVTWTWIGENPDTNINTYYPSSIYNIRNVMKNNMTYANAGGGMGAIANVLINPSTNGILSVNITNPGTGYYRSPVVNIHGNGSGAILSPKLGLNSGRVITSTNGFIIGQQFVVYQGMGTPGIFEVSTVDSNGKILSINIIDRGSYTMFPQIKLMFYNDYSIRTEILFDLGVYSVDVVDPGMCYTFGNTYVDFLGKELIPDWQISKDGGYFPSIPLANITFDGSVIFANDQFIENQFEGTQIETKLVKIVQEGVAWDGNTTFDNDTCVFDFYERTRFVEVRSANQTIFDGSYTYLDLDTTFDQKLNKVSTDQLTTSNIILDEGYTVIDQPVVFQDSKYSSTWILPFGKPYK